MCDSHCSWTASTDASAHSVQEQLEVELNFYSLPKQTDLVHATFNEEEEETLSVRQVNQPAYKESVPATVQEVYKGVFTMSSGLKGPFLWNPATD